MKIPLTSMPWRCPDKPIRAAQDMLGLFEKMGGYIATVKFDGYRAIADWNGSQVGLYSGRGIDRGGPTVLPVSDEIAKMTCQFFVDNKIPAGTRLDGEWLGRRHAGREQLIIFGVQYYNGAWLGAEPERIRWELVKNLLYNSPLVSLAESAESGYDKFFQMLKSRDLKRDKSEWRLEGIVLKHEKGQLVGDIKTNKKNPTWFKAKWRDGATGKDKTF